MFVRKGFILVFAVLLPTLATAQVYKHVDEKGNVTFSDQPAPNAEKIDINPTNTTAPPSAEAFPPPPPPAPAEAETAYKLAITSPANETIIPRGPGNFSVSASVSPALKGSHMLQLMMDGEAREEPQKGTTWTLTNVFRGEHTIQVAVIDGDGKQLNISDGIKVFVFRPSVNDANRGPGNRPPRPTPLN
jgi:hypothetical protein